MTYWNLSSTFVGFTMTQPTSQVVTLSTTADTIVDIEIDAPSTPSQSSAYLAPFALALSGGFKIADPSTNNVTNVGALVAQNETDAVNPYRWFIRLIIPAQPSAVSVRILSWGTFAIFSSGTN